MQKEKSIRKNKTKSKPVPVQQPHILHDKNCTYQLYQHIQYNVSKQHVRLKQAL